MQLGDAGGAGEPRYCVGGWRQFSERWGCREMTKQGIWWG